MTNTLPCALLGPRQNKVHWRNPVEQAVCRVLKRLGTWQTQPLCYVPCPRHTANNATFAVCHVDRHTAKNGSFAVCLAMAHGKKWWHTAKLIFRFLFFV